MTTMITTGSSRRLLTALLSLSVALFFTLGTASMVDAAESKKKKAAAKRNYIPSEATGKKLLKASEFAEEEKFQEAIDILLPLSKKKRLKKFDKATVFQTLGFMQAALEDYDNASQSFESALKVDYLPPATTEQLKYNLAQLYMATSNFPRAVELFEEWFENAENPGAQAEFMITAAYAQTDQWDKALPHARAAVTKSKEPVEQRLGLQLAAEFQNGNIPQTLEVLKVLVTVFPRKRYYEQLAYGYSNLGEEDKALAIMQLIHDQGWFTKDKEYVGLAQRFLFAGLPYQASKIMNEGLEKEVVPPEADHYELLANSLLHAREYDLALEPLTKAAEMAENGELYVRLAQVYLEVENWKSARQALESAVAKGDLRDIGQAQLLLGISNFNEKRYKSARAAFLLASKQEKTAESAQKWLTHVQRALDMQQSG
jgi:tetratricopeptide (TPR) repeat protein